ncbi:MAG: hypothetical protein A2516_09780 [Alphaproteobacteria bacterium RIFOXYD12_FULL_60_8]|nr:MAG: hypothetical protein A2516_09780 [Alphaproteobacteria bacterium RIFOXYD12_FULL_60_8]
MARRIVTVFGGSGFLGRHVVQRLARTGALVRVAVRDAEAAQFLKPLGDLGQIVIVRADITEPSTIAKAVRGADWVINLVGILHSSGHRSFRAVHAMGAGRLAKAAAASGATRFVHISALGADRDSPSAYQMTKAEGEAAVLKAFPTATILRPGVMFGPDDQFFNRFASLLRISPVLPVFTTHFTGDLSGPKFQPVYVGDVADAVLASLTDETALGKTFELGGPDVMTMRQVMEYIVEVTGRPRFIMPVHTDFIRFVAIFTQFWPKPPITPDQITVLESDNVLSGTKPGLRQLGISPETIGAVVPTYLSRYRLHHNMLRFRKS